MPDLSPERREELAKALYRMNGHAWYGRDLGGWDDPESRIGRNPAERDRWYKQADALLVVERSPHRDRAYADLMGRAAARLREVLPSFTDPRHYANHADIALVRDLEARVFPPG